MLAPWVSATLLATLSKADETFNFAIGGDPQPWRTDCNVTGCPNPNEPSSSKVWLPLAQKAYTNMRKYNPQFVMINGDMTDYGWRGERNSISNLINGNGDLQTFYGLGNHDIENNVNDCRGSPGDYGYTTANACAFAMSDTLRIDIFKKFDMKSEGYFNGSVALTGNVRVKVHWLFFIQPIDRKRPRGTSGIPAFEHIALCATYRLIQFLPTRSEPA